MKTCSQCGTEKEDFAFHNRTTSRDGLNNHCKACKSAYAIAYRANNREAYRQRQRDRRDKRKGSRKEYYEKNKTLMRLKGRAYKYNMSVDALVAFLNRTDGFCEICKLKKNLFVDHDHRTGKVRGVLCRECNSLIGYAGEKEGVLLSAIDYIKRVAER